MAPNSIQRSSPSAKTNEFHANRFDAKAYFNKNPGLLMPLQSTAKVFVDAIYANPFAIDYQSAAWALKSANLWISSNLLALREAFVSSQDILDHEFVREAKRQFNLCVSQCLANYGSDDNLGIPLLGSVIPQVSRPNTVAHDPQHCVSAILDSLSDHLFVLDSAGLKEIYDNTPSYPKFSSVELMSYALILSLPQLMTNLSHTENVAIMTTAVTALWLCPISALFVDVHALQNGGNTILTGITEFQIAPDQYFADHGILTVAQGGGVAVSGLIGVSRFSPIGKPSGINKFAGVAKLDDVVGDAIFPPISSSSLRSFGEIGSGSGGLAMHQNTPPTLPWAEYRQMPTSIVSSNRATDTVGAAIWLNATKPTKLELPGLGAEILIAPQQIGAHDYMGDISNSDVIGDRPNPSLPIADPQNVDPIYLANEVPQAVKQFSDLLIMETPVEREPWSTFIAKVSSRKTWCTMDQLNDTIATIIDHQSLFPSLAKIFKILSCNDEAVFQGFVTEVQILKLFSQIEGVNIIGFDLQAYGCDGNQKSNYDLVISYNGKIHFIETTKSPFHAPMLRPPFDSALRLAVIVTIGRTGDRTAKPQADPYVILDSEQELVNKLKQALESPTPPEITDTTARQATTFPLRLPFYLSSTQHPPTAQDQMICILSKMMYYNRYFANNLHFRQEIQSDIKNLNSQSSSQTFPNASLHHRIEGVETKSWNDMLAIFERINNRNQGLNATDETSQQIQLTENEILKLLSQFAVPAPPIQKKKRPSSK